MKKISIVIKVALVFIFTNMMTLLSQKLTLNNLEYFESRGFNVLVFSNQYNGFFFDEKTAGIEIIHHGVRTATGGAVRLSHTPEQWDQIPIMVNRKVDKNEQSIEVTLRYDLYNFDVKVKVKAIDDGVLISTILDKPLPKELEGKAGFNLEFLPSAYFGKTFLIDGRPGICPRYPSGPAEVKPVEEKIPQFANHSTFDDRGRKEFVQPKPIAEGKVLVLAPEDDERRIKIESKLGPLMLFDGRNIAQNGWYVVRSFIPANKTGVVVEWHLNAGVIKDWIRKPNIAFSQAGYHPSQKKFAIIELDPNDKIEKEAYLFKVNDNGDAVNVFKGKVSQWGKYLRYVYAMFDFSSVNDTGIFFIQYGNHKTNVFPISRQVYKDIWNLTLDVWFPVQMDHMFVNEAYRVWHGVPYLDDALQAPVNHEHFDGYRMSSTTDTKYKPFERIPGLNVGGWFDAGDFDIQTASHCSVVLSFVDTWERFGLKHDQTFIDQSTRYVDIHRPDGKPDILQQIEHGTLQLVAQQKYIGHAVRGIVVGNLHQYHHLGDASTITDNLPYNPELKPYETDGKSSGTLDDRWVFTNRIPWLNYHAAAALAAAYRALKGYNDSLANEALHFAIQAWEKEQKYKAEGNGDPWFRSRTDLLAALELYRSTKDSQYVKYFYENIWSALNDTTKFRYMPVNMLWNMPIAVRAALVLDEKYLNQFKPYVQKYLEFSNQLNKLNPFGVPLENQGWGSNTLIINWGITHYLLNKTFPDLVNTDNVLKAAYYIFGCHPYSNLSFILAVGVQSKKVAYGGNRADFSIIPGGVVPGLLQLKPDLLENKDDWPFLWGENECVIDGCAAYIFFANAIQELVNKK